MKKSLKAAYLQRDGTTTLLHYDVKVYHSELDGDVDANLKEVSDHFDIILEQAEESNQVYVVARNIEKLMNSYGIDVDTRTFYTRILGNTDEYGSTTHRFIDYIPSLRYHDETGIIMNPNDFSFRIKCAVLIKTLIHIPVKSMNYLKIKNPELYTRLQYNISSSELSELNDRFMP